MKSSWLVKGFIAGLILTAFTLILAYWSGLGSSILAISIAWLLVTSMVWGLGLAWGVGRLLSTSQEQADPSRKRMLGELAVGSLVVTAFSIGLGRWLMPRPESQEVVVVSFTPPPTTIPPTGPPPKAGFEPVPGTRPEIAPIEDLYRVDINLLPLGDAEFLDSSDPLVKSLLEQGG